MFHKPFKIKSNSPVRGSERKLIKRDLAFQYPALSHHDIDEMIPSKGLFVCVKCEGVKGGGVCTYYVVNKDPVLFLYEGTLYPTVYTLWDYPDMLQCLSTWMPVGVRLKEGADLMLPGVATLEKGGFDLRGVAKGQPVAVNIVGNRCPMAVGLAVKSYDEMMTSGMRGKGVEILHVYKDQLWAMGSKKETPLLVMGMQQASDLTSDQSDSDVSDDPHNGSSGEDFPTVLSSLNSDLKGDAKTGADSPSASAVGTSKPTVTPQKVGGARVRPKKWKSKVKPPPTPSPNEPLDPMSKTTEKKIKRLYKQHHKRVTKQQWNKLMGRDLRKKEELGKGDAESPDNPGDHVTSDREKEKSLADDKENSGSKATSNSQGSEVKDGDAATGKSSKSETGTFEVTRHTVTDVYLDNLEEQLSKQGKQSMADNTELLAEIRAEMAKATEPVSVLIDLEKQSYKILPVKEAQRQKYEYSIVGNKIIRHSKKKIKNVKDEFDMLQEAIRKMIFHFRETHNVTEDTPLGDSLDEIEMKTFTNGKGGKLFIFMSIKDTDPFGCMVDFPTSKEAFVTQVPSPGSEVDRYDWWRQEPTANSIGILTGDGLATKTDIPDSPLWPKPSQARSKLEMLSSIFIGRHMDRATLNHLRLGGSKLDHVAAAVPPGTRLLASKLPDTWYSGAPDNPKKPDPPTRIPPTFGGKKPTAEDDKISHAIEMYLARQMAMAPRPIRQPTRQEAEVLYGKLLSSFEFDDLKGLKRIGEFLRAAGMSLDPPTIARILKLDDGPTVHDTIPEVDTDSSTCSDSSEEVVRSKYKGDSPGSDTEGLGWYHLPRDNHSDSDKEKSDQESKDECSVPQAIDDDLPSDPNMDGLLRECFLKAVRSKVKPNDIPLLTSTFYRSYMVEVCPAHLKLDLRKSSFKKLSRFLVSMETEGVLEVKTNDRGADTITKLNFSHELVRSFRPDLIKTATADKPVPEPAKPTSKGIVVEEMWSPSLHLAPIFSPLGYNKGSTLNASKVKEVVTSYIRENGLICEDNPKMVSLDPILHEAFKRRGIPPVDKLLWAQLFSKVFEEMRPSYGICHGSNPPIIRHSLPKVRLSLCRRANKTVTVVDNLDTYGIPPMDVAKNIQRVAACSSAMNVVPGRPGFHQVLIQGNQIKAAVKMLEGGYGLPLKYIEALDKVKPPKTQKRKGGKK